MFDCVIPTTLAWQGTAFTGTGRVRLTRGEYRLSSEPLDPACGCATCRTHSRGYLHHLVKCGEPLGPRLVSLHNLHHYLDLLRSIRAAIEEGRYDAFARERLAAIDRHEHDPRRRRPGVPREPRLGRAPVGGGGAPDVPVDAPERFEIVTTRSGAPAVLDRAVGEVMHPVVGAAAEAEDLYVTQSRLEERLAQAGPPLVVFDVGLGAGSNALAAIRAARRGAPPARPLEVISFERDTGALELACSDDGAARLGLAREDQAAARALLAAGEHVEPGLRWRLVAGDARETLATFTGTADVVFWDPYSPRRDGALWTVAAFLAVRARCAAGATLFTYSTATAVRSALLLAGFYVGVGTPSGPKEGTTAAAVRRSDLAAPLDQRWLERLARSSAALPPDAPPDALDRIRAHPQFAANDVVACDRSAR
jgi:queuine tRNA-ribosyltransferase